MPATTTVIFADLTGSTSLFEVLGNELATRTVTTLTQWIGTVVDENGGRVVKTLGDGVLAVFPDGIGAVHAAVDLQRQHAQRLQEWPKQVRMRLQVGVASGEVVDVDGDCYGDAVNMASRLSDLSGADQIWATKSVVTQHRSDPHGVRFRSLGPVPIRGKSNAVTIYRVEWEAEVHTMNLTVPAALAPNRGRLQQTPASQGIELSWLDQQMRFTLDQLPVHLGRDGAAHFEVNDQRVSRVHARIDWRNGTFILTDLSSYGTWVRFNGNSLELALRRNDCVLVSDGEIALGASFDDFTVPTVAFTVTGGR